MSDEKLIEFLGIHASKLESDGWELAPAMLRNAADRLKQLTAAKEAPEWSFEVRVAIAVSSEDGDVLMEAEAIYDNDEECVNTVRRRVGEDNLVAECIATVHVPKRIVLVPEVDAQIESVER